MAIININFDKKSIQNAIKQVEQIKKKMNTEVPTAFLRRCLNWVQVRANEYLSSFNIDPKTTNDIKSKWETDITGSIGKLTNTSDKAVFIEFGVGRIGDVASHPNANSAGYEYNKPSANKDGYGKWRFKLDDQYGIDLVAGYYSQKGDTITTAGSPATLYLYNAMMDLISSGVYKQFWQQALKETI